MKYRRLVDKNPGLPEPEPPGAALFGWSRNRFFGPAPAPTPRTVNILFLETLSMTRTVTMATMTTVTDECDYDDGDYDDGDYGDCDYGD